MLKRFALLSFLVTSLGLAFYFNSRPTESEAQLSQISYWCPANIQSTQARVQNTIQTPWEKHITVGCDRSFNVGSFHNNTGVFSTDTLMQVTGQANFNAFFSNGDKVQVPADGLYTLYVNTAHQYDPARCSDQATVMVSCNIPQVTSCRYGSTQARVQLNDRSPWSRNLNLSCGQVFEVGAFHDGNGSVFANDSHLWVAGPQGLNQAFKNDDKIRALFPGRYTLTVTTPGQSGPACEETAIVDVSCTDWWRIN